MNQHYISVTSGKSPSISRRSFIQTTTLGLGGITFGFSLPGCASFPKVDARGEIELNSWISIDKDNLLTFTSSKSEMGQNVYTALITLLAEELNTHPKFFKVRPAPVDDAYTDPKFPYQVTWSSSSVMHLYDPLRMVGSSIFDLIERAGVEYFKSPNIYIEDGFVYTKNKESKVRFADLISLMSKMELREVPSKKKNSFKYIGTTKGKVDPGIVEKVTGQVRYNIDQNESFLVGLVLRPPVISARFIKMDPTEALKVNGVDSVHKISRGVVVLAKDYWSALKGRDQLKVQWDLGEFKSLSSKKIAESYRKTTAEDLGSTVLERGDLNQGKEQSSKKIVAEFEFPYLAHGTLEPQNCAARFSDGELEVWAPTQHQSFAQEAAAKAAGISRNSVKLHTAKFLGGGFGRRNATDFVQEAVETAMVSKKAVKIIWTREDDMRHSPCRPLYVHRVEAGIQADGQPSFWKQNLVGQGIIQANAKEFGAAVAANWLPRFIKNFTGSLTSGAMDVFVNDPSSFEGAEELPYSIPNVEVKYQHEEQPVPVHFWRSVGHSHTAFVKETIIDDLANLGRKDPFVFRRSLLSHDSRHLRVLDRLEKFSGWSKPSPQNHYRGMAIHKSYGSVIGQVCEISIDENQEIIVHKVHCVIDCGQAVDPENIRAQIQGAVVWGINHTLYNDLNMKDGSVEQGNFDDYPLLRLKRAPKVLVDILDLDEKPTGVGEPAVPVIGPALANAVFKATGMRLRKLPLKLP